MHRSKTSALLLVLSVASGLFLLCVTSGVTTVTAMSQDEPVEPPKPEPLVIPPSERNRKNPIPASTESIRWGRELFASQCAMCHGKNGNGKGDLAERLQLKIPDLTNPAVQKKRTDGELFYIITNGHGRMPADGERLSEEWRWCMVHAIRSMAGSER